jgi:hypothetical protein
MLSDDRVCRAPFESGQTVTLTFPDHQALAHHVLEKRPGDVASLGLHLNVESGRARNLSIGQRIAAASQEIDDELLRGEDEVAARREVRQVRQQRAPSDPRTWQESASTRHKDRRSSIARPNPEWTRNH